MRKYTVRVSKDYLGFCSAHFIVFGSNVCERLHGHNYQVAAEIEDDDNAEHTVHRWILFAALRGRTLCSTKWRFRSRHRRNGIYRGGY